MKNSIKIILPSTILALCLATVFLGGVVLAQEETDSTEVTQAIELDQNIQASDLDTEEPRLLPDSPFYFLKDWGRQIRFFITFDSVGKLKLKEGFANEKLIELKKLIEQKKNSKTIEKAAESYQNEVESIKTTSEKIKDKAGKNKEIESFLDKYTRHQLLHQRLLEKLEGQVPEEAFLKIKTARERHLETFAEVMTKLEDRKEKTEERLEKNMEEMQGSKYKNFTNLEILLRLEEKVPAEAKDAIRRAQEAILNRLQGDLEKMSPEDQERFKEYLERIGGVKEGQVEILENLRSEIREQGTNLGEKIIEARESVMERMQEANQALRCAPFASPPAKDFCPNGKVVIEKDEKGCYLPPKCVNASR